MAWDSPSKSLCLFDLPTELLVQALKNIDGLTLVRCRSVCRTFKNLIESHTELQYTIQLFVDGMVDGPPSALTAADRLALLLDRRKAWALLQWNKQVMVSTPGPCQAYELVGGVFVKSMISDGVLGASRHLLTSRLPSTGRSAHMVAREDLGFSCSDFAIDPSQDLIVFLEAKDTSAEARREITIHICSISTNESHPAASSPILHRPTRFHIYDSLIQIADDVIGVFFCARNGDNTNPRLVVWNWKDGKLCVDISEAYLPPDTYDFSFLSNKAYVLTCRKNNGSIEIFTFDNPRVDPEAQENSTVLSKHMVSLRLPEINIDSRVAHILIHTGPFEASCPSDKPFTTSPDNRIFVISVLYGCIEGEHVIFPARSAIFLHSRTILRYTSMRQRFTQPSLPGLPLNEAPHTPLVVNWKDWGPMDTRFIQHGAQFSWLRYIHGQRVICPTVISLSSNQHEITILDFNQCALRAHLFEYLIGEDDQELGSTISNSLEIEPTRIPPNHIFKEEILTYLPYYMVTREGLNLYSGFMIDEERLVGLKSNAFATENLEDLHVFTF